MPDLRELVKHDPIMSSLSEEELAQLTAVAEPIPVRAGEVIFRQGDTGRDTYFLPEGRVEVWVDSPTGPVMVSEATGPCALGEVAYFTGQPRTATLKASEDLLILRLPAEHLEAIFNPEEDFRFLLMRQVAHDLAERLKAGTDARVEALTQALQASQALSDLGRLITFVIGLMVVYGFVLTGLVGLLPPGASSTYVSGPLIIVLGVGIAGVAHQSGRGWAFYGLHLQRWAQHLWTSFLWTAPFLVGVTLFKAYLITQEPALEGWSLFVAPERLTGNFFVLLLIYVLLSPAQEFITTKGNYIRTRTDRVLDQWFSLEPKRSNIHKAAAAQILHDRDFVFPPQFHQFLETNFSSESDNLIVTGVHIQ